MSSPTTESSTPAVAAEPEPAPPAAARPLHPNIYRPVTPPAALSSNGDSPRVFAKFMINTVALLRIVAIGLSIALVVLELDAADNGLAVFFIVLAFFQLLWLFFALIAQGNHRSRRSNKGKGLTIDLGFVKCIFGRRGCNDDDGTDEVLLDWVPGSEKKWSRAALMFSAIDLIFAAITFTVGMIATSRPWCWYWGKSTPIAVIGIVVACMELFITVAQQFAILKRAKIQVLYDDDEDEDDIGSHKYRIRLPESPEPRKAVMSVAAH